MSRRLDPRISPCILGSCCLPWTESFELDEEIFRQEIRGQIDRGHNNLYLFGTAGEGYALTLGQYERISRIFVEETEGKTGLRQLGVIGLSLAQVQERIEMGQEMGVNSFQLSFPSWGKLNDGEVELFFEGTCGRYPDSSFLFYNVGRGLRLLSGPELGALAERHPNLVAVKWATAIEPDQMESVVNGAPQLCFFFSDIKYIPACLQGLTCGLLIAMSASNRLLATEIFELGQTRADDDRLRKYCEEMTHHGGIMRELPLQGSHMDGTFDKLLCKLHLREFPLRLLPPYRGNNDAAFEIYLARLQAELPHWIEPPL